MIDKKVVVVATGGTIAMKYDKEKHGLVPACSGKDLADAVPGLGDIAPLEFVQFSNIASPGMTPQNMWDLHCKIEELLARDDVAGVVVKSCLLSGTILPPAVPLTEYLFR